MSVTCKVQGQNGILGRALANRGRGLTCLGGRVKATRFDRAQVVREKRRRTTSIQVEKRKGVRIATVWQVLRQGNAPAAVGWFSITRQTAPFGRAHLTHGFLFMPSAVSDRDSRGLLEARDIILGNNMRIAR
jgi:hypothetical protein